MIFLVNGSRINQVNFSRNVNHPNVKLTVQINPSRFLNTEIMIKNGIIETCYSKTV